MRSQHSIGWQQVWTRLWLQWKLMGRPPWQIHHSTTSSRQTKIWQAGLFDASLGSLALKHDVKTHIRRCMAEDWSY